LSALETLKSKLRIDKESPWYYYQMVFVISFIVSACITIPFIIYELIQTGSAVFLYYGDYNAQQIPFYEHCIRMVQEGSFGWDWVTDMGSNFIGSYSYYMLGSPFFWVMCIFPASWAPYLMAPMYMVKYIVASVLAYAYLQRFVKNKNYAVIGAVLYAFSGFQIYNTFFNQFHDVVALFPLLLIGMEEYVQNDRKGLFAIAVCLNAMVNYFMFVGQVFFCIIYFLCRFTTKSFRITVGKFFGLVFESVIGLLLAFWIFLPGAASLMGNSRLDSSYLDMLSKAIEYAQDKDWDAAGKTFKRLFVYQYGDEFYWQRYGQIFESYFFPPDIPSRVNFFYGHETRWASISMYLPLVGLNGVFALFTVKKRAWLKRIVVILTIMSFVPILNSVFFLFNTSYYARWLYMMIMMFALATAVALDDARTKWKLPTAISTIICTLIVIPLGFVWHENENTVFELGYPPRKDRFWIWVALAFIGIGVTAYLIRKYRGTKVFERALLIAISGMTVFYGCLHILNGKEHSHASKFLVDQCIEGTVTLPDTHKEFYRIDQYKSNSISTLDNLGIFWEYPTIECFHTVVPSSIMEFYPMIDVTRNVGSRAPSSLYGLRAFTSVRYSLIESAKNQDKTEHNTYGFTYLKSENGFDIYENDNFIPMGFAYNEFMTQTDFEKCYDENVRHRVLCTYLVVPDDMADYYSKFMTRVTNGITASTNNFEKSVEARRQTACDSFDYSSDGFTATITLEEPEIVYFSVPYEDHGWSATVNGKEKDVLKVTYGFVAVECEAGKNTIVFDYSTPGLVTGATYKVGDSEFTVFGGVWFTLIAAVIFAIYMLYFKVFKKQRAATTFFSFEYYDDMDAYAIDEPKKEIIEKDEVIIDSEYTIEETDDDEEGLTEEITDTEPETEINGEQ